MKKLIYFCIVVLLMCLYTQAVAVTIGNARYRDNVPQRYLSESYFGECFEGRMCAETSSVVYLYSSNGNMNDLDIDLDGIVPNKKEKKDFIDDICYNSNASFCRDSKYFRNGWGHGHGNGNGNGGGNSPNNPSNPVPEPASMLLFGTGLVMLGFILNKRRTKT